MPKTLIEPFRIKSIEPIRMTTRAEREQLLAAAKLNVFQLRAEDVLIDWLTDSGTGAMSSKQWGAIMEGDESYAGARSFYRLQAVIQDITGMAHFVPTHQGRAAERVLFTAACKKGDLVPNNSHFDTTRANLEYQGVEAVDLVIPQGLQPALENAMFIKMREPGYENTPIKTIVQEMFSYADGATMSAKKDGMVNIGGFIVLRSDEWMDAVRNVLIMTEGFPTYGGLAGRDLEALAVGLEEGMQEDYLRYRLRTAEYLGERLEAAGVGFVKPTGGHAVYIDAKTVLPAMPVQHYPAWALCNALYLEGGIRGVEIGSVMFGKRLADGSETYHNMELVRLAFPRRMYTQSHFDYAAEVIAEVKQKASQIRGVKITKQPQYLRHFTCECEWV